MSTRLPLVVLYLLKASLTTVSHQEVHTGKDHKSKEAATAAILPQATTWRGRVLSD